MNKKNRNILSLSISASLMAMIPACGDSDGNTTSATTGATAGATAGTTAGAATTAAGTTTPGGGTAGTTKAGDTTGNGGGGAACADPKNPNAPIVEVTSNIMADTTWTCDKIYSLKNLIRVKAGTLTIQAGTTVLGDPPIGADNKPISVALVIEQTAKINAVGTADKPIVFTSAKPAGGKNRGDWGGLVLAGRARINAKGGTASAEGFKVDPPLYGGNDDAHNCGNLQYVRVEWAGQTISPGDELNGISFYACGTGTKVHHVQSHMGKDDGIEWFGGGFDANHIVVTGAADDSLDMDQGFRGKIQHVLIQQDPAAGDAMLELSSSKETTHSPITLPQIANATLIGSHGSNAGLTDTVGIVLKEGVTLELYNSIVLDPKKELLNLTNESTAAHLTSGATKFNGNIMRTSATPAFKVGDAASFTDATLAAWFTTAPRVNKVGDNPMIPSTIWTTPNVKPAPNGITATSGTTLPAGFMATSYVGAVDPNGTADWTKEGWINYSVQ